METNKELLYKVVAAFNTGEVSQVDSLFSSKYIDHQNDADRDQNVEFDGPEEFKQIVSGARKSMPDLIVTIEDETITEDKVIARLKWTSIGESRNLVRETIDILRVENSIIVEHWGAEEWRKERAS